MSKNRRKARGTVGVLAALAATAVATLCVAAPASAESRQLIDGSGPVDWISVGEELGCQASYVNDVAFEFYPPATSPGDCGTMLAVNGVLYAPGFSTHSISATSGLGEYVPFTPVSQTGVEGEGTAGSPFRVTTVVDAGSTGLRLSQTTTYVNGSNSYRVEIAVTNTGGSQLNPVLYHAGDCYASGSDIGYGFVRDEVGTAGCSQSAQNSPPGRTIQMSPLSAGSSYYEAFYREVWERIATMGPFPDTCRCGEHIDNGIGLSWELSLLPHGGGTVRSLSVSFTESTPPDPGADSDGDALPDGWETGNASDGGYESLAPLGADPNRKDIFVHVDYKKECAPPPGWERPAIEVFKEHGIALHVDSGPDSLNHDLQKWGSNSRAGAIEVGDDIRLWDDYDRLKDQRFVAANRRRAFHYVAIVNKFDGGDGGQSRGIPEADIVLTGCGVPDWIRLKLKRYITTTFVHELGHNLGLLHGGGDHVNAKPNYYGIMNYYWALLGGIGKGSVKFGLPEFSWHTRPEIDERHVNEREPQIQPVAWNCPGSEKLDIRYELARGVGLVDWDCNGVYGDVHHGLNLNDGWDREEMRLTGFNDWRDGVMRFDGGGVLGNFHIPERPNPPVERELTRAEFGTVQQALRRSNRRGRRQLVLFPSRLRLLPRRVAKLRIRVGTRSGKRRVRGALVTVTGAVLIRPSSRRGARASRRPARRLRTGRRGKLVLRLRTRRRGAVRIVAKRRGYKRGGLIVPVRRKGR